ncbi:AlpA family phage regulatory protein [Halomonas sp. ATBC28]|uniref:AlpA family phage regulatory protein n=1 Tax=Halomonas sp. ATBC28 TaxID=2545264 RepID=UPI00110E38DF|nr:AlpA family phage regulatory protein [Halomonas sp. ATBC28]TMU14888.1 AlpA family phage regulatory protein [Halomonas sp. ATBC28]
MHTINPPVTIIRMQQLRQKLSISRSSIYEKINPRSPRYDATFPKPIKLGAAAVGWVESEVDQWIMNGASVL